MTRLIGDAYIAILPEASMFRPDTEAKMKAALAGLRGKIPLVGDASDINKKIAAIAAALKGVDGDIPLSSDNRKALTDISAVSAALDNLRHRAENIDFDGNDSKLISKVFGVLTTVEGLQNKLQHLDADGSVTPILAKLYSVKALIDDLEKSSINVGVTVPTKLPGGGAKGTNPFAYGVQNLEGVTKSEAQYMDQLTAKTLDSMTAFEKLNAVEKDNGSVSPFVAAGLKKIADTQSMLIAGNAGGWWGAMSTKVRLFGGALDSILPKFLTQVTVWHIAADAVLEFAAAWAPALIAITAFGAVAGPIAQKIYGQWKNINTVIDSVGGRLPDLGTAFDTISRAVQPTVLILFGEYLKTVGGNATALGTALQKVGLVADAWGAALVNWASRAKAGFARLVSIGAGNFAVLGDSFHQLFRIIASLIKDLPGYVYLLLKLGDAVLKISADVIQAIGPFIKVGLAIHGFLLYVGLAVTGVVALGRAMAAGALASYARRTGQDLMLAGDAAAGASGKFSRFGTAVGAFAGSIAGFSTNAFKYSRSVIAVGRDTGIASAGSKLLRDGLAALPFGPVGIAAGIAAAVIGGVLYFQLRHTTTAAEQFNKAMQELILNSTTANFGQNLQLALTKTTDKINTSTNAMHRLAGSTKAVGNPAFINPVTGAFSALGQQVSSTSKDVQTYQNQQRALITDANTYGARLNILRGVFGSTGGAQAALNAIGIKAGTVATENNKAWQTQLTELRGLAAGYGYMGQSGSRAANQLNTLNIATGTTTKNLQTLTQAESAWVSMLTSGDSAFTTFAQGQQTLSSAMKQGSASGTTLSVTVGKLRNQYKLTGTTLNGTTTSALAARQAFVAQLNAGQTLYGNLQQLAAASGNTTKAQSQLNQAGKDIVKTLLPMAGGSKQATTELYGLAQVAGYTGPNNFKKLAQWVGNTKNAEGDLNKQQMRLTQSSANLTQAAKNLGNSLQAQITSSQGAAIATKTGLVPATQNLARAAGSAHGKLTQLSVTASRQYVNSLMSAGLSTKQATDYLNAYLQKLGFSPGAIKQIDNALKGNVSNFQKQQQAMKNSGTASENTKGKFIDFGHIVAVVGDTVANVFTQTLPHAFSAGYSRFVNDFMHPVEGAFDSTRHAMAATADAIGSFFTSSLPRAFSTGFARFQNDFMHPIENAFDNTRHAIASIADAIGNIFTRTLPHAFGVGYTGFQNDFMHPIENAGHSVASFFRNTANTIGSFFTSTLPHAFGSGYARFQNNFVHPIESAGRAVVGFFHSNIVNPLVSLFTHTIPAAFAAGVGGVSRAWAGFKGAVEGPVKFVVNTVYDGGIARFWNDIGPKIGLGKLPTFHLAGGGVVPGGIHGRDSVPAMLAPGELVIPSSHAPAFGDMAKKAGIPGFAGGGVIPNPIGAVIHAGESLLKGVTGLFTKIASKGMGAVMNSIVKPLENAIPSGSTALSQMPKDIIKTIVSAAINTLTSGFNSSGSGAPGSNFSGSVPGGFGNLLVIAKYLMANGLNRAAAAGMAATIYGECVTLDAMILTKRGWLKHDEVQTGDETIGYNPATGKSQWTTVTRVMSYAQQPTVTYGNSYWQATFTPNHRWLTERAVRVIEPLSREISCAQCDYIAGTNRGLRQHMRQIHGKHGLIAQGVRQEDYEVWQTPEFISWNKLKGDERLILSREADTGSGLPITDNEAALLGWITGDGSVMSDGRVFVYQSKIQNFSAIENCIPDGQFTVTERDRRGRNNGQGFGVTTLKDYTWYIRQPYADNLIQRAGNPKTDSVSQVLRMSSSQRHAWFSAVIAAEGSVTASGRTTIYQNEGPIAEAIELAAYLEGYRAARNVRRGNAVSIGLASPTIGGPKRRSFTENSGLRDVWCVTTELGSWTARNKSGIFLTGNSAGSPEAVGSGGFGLIGWTGNTIGLPAGYSGPTGNIQRDMAIQLRGVIGYMNSRGGAGALNAAGNAVAAGDVWSRMEAPLVPLSDTRPGIANQIFSMLGGAAQAAGAQVHPKKHSAGGMVSEPVFGFGSQTGLPYSFAEGGPEYVGPLSGANSPNAPGLPGATSYGQQTTNQLLGMMVKLLQQAPYAYASATSRGTAQGARHGYYSGQN